MYFHHYWVCGGWLNLHNGQKNCCETMKKEKNHLHKSEREEQPDRTGTCF